MRANVNLKKSKNDDIKIGELIQAANEESTKKELSSNSVTKQQNNSTIQLSPI